MAEPVLLVESDPFCLSALSLLISSPGYRPLPFPSIQAACAALDRLEGRPEAMITEFNLHNGCAARCLIDGVRRRWGRMPIVVLTADTSKAARTALADLDCHVLFKPSPAEDILRLLPPVARRQRSA